MYDSRGTRVRAWAGAVVAAAGFRTAVVLLLPKLFHSRGVVVPRVSDGDGLRRRQRRWSWGHCGGVKGDVWECKRELVEEMKVCGGEDAEVDSVDVSVSVESGVRGERQ